METLPNGELQAIQANAETTQDMFLVFTIDEQNYAIEITYVTEIIEVMPITALPSLPGCMKGIINLRGAIIPIMDVRLRFTLPEREYTERTCIIVINNNESMLGLIVDAVQEVTIIEPEVRMPPPSNNASGNVRYIKGVSTANESIQMLLDCDKLMDILGS